MQLQLTLVTLVPWVCSCRTQVVDLITQLHTLTVDPSCTDHLSLPEGWESYLAPVVEENYGIISGTPAPEVSSMNLYKLALSSV